MKRTKAKLALMISIVLLTGILSGCSSTKTDSADSAVTTIYVGTQNDYPPFAYSDADGQLTGFDVEVIKEINKKLDGYQFEFVASSWDSIFLSLESNKTQIVADEIAKNPEREQKYLFSDESYFAAQTVIAVKKGRSDIHSLEDLEGLNVAATVGDSYTMLLEEYNAAHGNKIKLQYNESSNPADNLLNVESGRVDAFVNDPVMMGAIIKKQELQVEIVGDPIQSDNMHLVFKKDEQGEALKAKIDPIIKQLKEDGTLQALSEKWTGGEFIPE